MRKVLLVSLASVAALTFLSCSGEKAKEDTPAKNHAPTSLTRYALIKGAPVWKVPHGLGDKPFRTLAYGEAITPTCTQGTYTFIENGLTLEVNQSATTTVTVPAGTLYARGVARVYDQDEGYKIKRKLKYGEKVRVQRFKPGLGGRIGRVEIGEGQWVNESDLQERPETAEEHRQRVTADASRAKAEREATKANETAQAEARRAYAKVLRNHFLDQGMDVKVGISGARADRLRLEFILFNAVWTRKMETGSLLGEIRDQGFKRLDMQGYEYHVNWTWK